MSTNIATSAAEPKMLTVEQAVAAASTVTNAPSFDEIAALILAGHADHSGGAIYTAYEGLVDGNLSTFLNPWWRFDSDFRHQAYDIFDGSASGDPLLLEQLGEWIEGRAVQLDGDQCTLVQYVEHFGGNRVEAIAAVLRAVAPAVMHHAIAEIAMSDPDAGSDFVRDATEAASKATEAATEALLADPAWAVNK